MSEQLNFGAEYQSRPMRAYSVRVRVVYKDEAVTRDHTVVVAIRDNETLDVAERKAEAIVRELRPDREVFSIMTLSATYIHDVHL